MSFKSALMRYVDHLPLPDSLALAGIKALCKKTSQDLRQSPANINSAFVQRMSARRIAEATEAANAQHYEIPEAFFGYVLGPHRKYSCCLFDRPGMTLLQAEIRALQESAAHAELQDGQSILELGCGWGSLSLFMAVHYPRAQITSVSNSHSQREYIMAEAQKRGLANLRVVTCDMNDFQPEQDFDRIVSVEMFEHMSNWRSLLERLRGWLKADGKLFLHVFSHRSTPYAFESEDKSDWIAQYFFTGGIMPSHKMIHEFSDVMRIEREWQWQGTHYQKTALQWLRNYDRHQDAITPILKETYGKNADVWRRRWRLFFLATAGLFGFDQGREWGISHYLLTRT